MTARDPNWGYRNLVRGVNAAAKVLAVGGIEIQGHENLPSHGGYIVVMNHPGTIDPGVVAAALGRDDVYFMGKQEVFDPVAATDNLLTDVIHAGTHAARNALLNAAHAIPVKRGTPDRAALSISRGLVDDGHVVVVATEGTRNPQMQRSHAGAILIAFDTAELRAAPDRAQESRLIVPIGITGTPDVFQKDSKLVHRAHIGVNIGQPCRLFPWDLDVPHGEPPRKLSPQDLMDQLGWKIAGLVPGKQRGVYSSHRALQTASPPAVEPSSRLIDGEPADWAHVRERLATAAEQAGANVKDRVDHAVVRVVGHAAQAAHRLADRGAEF